MKIINNVIFLFVKQVEIIRIIHADDHKLVRNAVQKLFSEHAPHIKIVAEASSYQELFGLLDTTEVDMLLLDGQINGGTTSQYLPIIRKKYPNIKILLLWVHSGEHSLTKWIHLLDGQLNLSTNAEDLIQAIKTIIKGETYFTLPVFQKHLK